MDPTLIAVALISSVPATIAATASWRNSKKSNAVLQGNGLGPVDKMLEDVIGWQQRHDARHLGLEGRLHLLEDEEHN